MKYAISVLMHKLAGTTVTSTHHLCVVEGVSKDECTGKAMRHAFAANKDYLIVGMQGECVEEPGSFPINVAWGLFNDDGGWVPNYGVDVSARQQRQENIEGGHLCAGCDYKPSHCVCLKEGV